MKRGGEMREDGEVKKTENRGDDGDGGEKNSRVAGRVGRKKVD